LFYGFLTVYVTALIGSAFALGVDWNEKDDPTGWWMTEKLDGVRVMWDGEKLFSRSGLALKLPRFFTQALPKLYLDCELWIGRQRGDDIAHLCRTAKPTDDTDEWDEVTLVVFDIPEFSDYPYEERMKVLDSLQLGTYARAIERRKCESREDLQQYLLDIVSKGGEGIMLRKPGSPYAIGRTDAMVKVKHFTEAEVQIVGTYPRNRTLLCEQYVDNCTKH
jgi:DNA ligase-1